MSVLAAILRAFCRAGKTVHEGLRRASACRREHAGRRAVRTAPKAVPTGDVLIL